MALRISTTARNAAANAVADLLDAGGTLTVYTGSQPATVGTAATGTALVEFTLPTPAFGAAATGTVTLDTDPNLSATASASGAAGWFRVRGSDDAALIDGAVATSGAELTLSTTSIVAGGTVSITSGVVTMPAG